MPIDLSTQESILLVRQFRQAGNELGLKERRHQSQEFRLDVLKLVL